MPQNEQFPNNNLSVTFIWEIWDDLIGFQTPTAS